MGAVQIGTNTLNPSNTKDMNLKEKTALITGASSGIGKSFAYLLASKGTHLILVARSEGKLEEISQDIKGKFAVNVSVYRSDLGQVGAAKVLYDQLKADDQPVDLLVNNAGFGKWGDFEEFSLAEYQNMVQLNVTSLMDLCYLFFEDLKKRPEAGIINVGSTASFLPVPYSAVYAATKAFVLNFTEGLVGELEGTNVKAFCLCPAGTATNFANVASDGKDDATENMKTPDEVAQEGLRAFLSGKHYVITGRKTSVLMTKVMSRKSVIKMVSRYWKKRLGKK
jgi:short-subunit dehydrogenase